MIKVTSKKGSVSREANNPDSGMFKALKVTFYIFFIIIGSFGLAAVYMEQRLYHPHPTVDVEGEDVAQSILLQIRYVLKILSFFFSIFIGAYGLVSLRHADA